MSIDLMTLFSKPALPKISTTAHPLVSSSVQDANHRAARSSVTHQLLLWPPHFKTQSFLGRDGL